MLLMGLFGGLAMLLSAVGIYGLLSHAVTQRTQEMGIRMALGAQVGDVLKLVLKQGMTLALAGEAIGLVGAFLLTRLIRGLLFGVTPNDAMTFVVVAGGINDSSIVGLLPSGASRDESRSVGGLEISNPAQVIHRLHRCL